MLQISPLSRSRLALSQRKKLLSVLDINYVHHFVPQFYTHTMCNFRHQFRRLFADLDSTGPVIATAATGAAASLDPLLNDGDFSLTARSPPVDFIEGPFPDASEGPLLDANVGPFPYAPDPNVGPFPDPSVGLLLFPNRKILSDERVGHFAARQDETPRRRRVARRKLLMAIIWMSFVW